MTYYTVTEPGHLPYKTEVIFRLYNLPADTVIVEHRDDGSRWRIPIMNGRGCLWQRIEISEDK